MTFIVAVLVIFLVATMITVYWLSSCVTVLQRQQKSTDELLNRLAKRFVMFKQNYITDLESSIKGLRVVGDIMGRVELLEQHYDDKFYERTGS